MIIKIQVYKFENKYTAINYCIQGVVIYLAVNVLL